MRAWRSQRSGQRKMTSNHALLHIAKAVDEASKEIDVQILQHLIPNTERMRAIKSDFGKIGASAAIPKQAM